MSASQRSFGFARGAHSRPDAPDTVTTVRGRCGATVELDAVTMRFGNMTVSRDVTLSIGAGEIVSIVGPSGCGKTTLLRAVAGLLKPVSGVVSINGEIVTRTHDAIAMVFQHFGLFPWKTVESNVAYSLRVGGMKKTAALARARDLIRLVGLSGFEKSYPYQLSGGMQQRTGLARALAMDPQLLLMDEPFGALDAQTREVLQFELLSIWQSNPATMLFVTHSIDEAVLFGNRVVVLKGRPSSVAEIVEVDLPPVRDRSVLAMPQFLTLREQVWSLVMSKHEEH